jgi:hypothetical protein
VIYIRPILVAPAKEHVLANHRRLKRLAGAMWAIGCFDGEALVGASVVGRPSARSAQQLGRLELIRMAVIEGHPNACSMLYGACARAARAMGAVDLWTYLHGDEPGTSVKAAGWIFVGMTAGGEWDRILRPRVNALDSKPKQKWCAPWSSMLTAIRVSGGDRDWLATKEG